MTIKHHLAYLSPKQLSALTGISVKQLERMRKKNSGPPFKRFSARKILYPVAECNAWFEQLENF